MAEALKPLAEVMARHDAELRAATDAKQFVVCTASTRVNVRVGPTTKTKIAGKMQSGQHAVVLGRSGDWVKVEIVDPLSGVSLTGWVYKKFLREMTVASSPSS